MKDTGGPAFPSDVSVSQGMTLRDYFAAQALTGMLASETADECYTKDSVAAMRAYDIADAMLAERSK